MRVERIEVRGISLPLRFRFETSVGATREKQFLLVSASADGVTGHGECVADPDPFYLPETNATALHVLRDFLAPIAFAATWSIEMPFRMLVASVLNGCAAVRNAPVPEAWSPGPSGRAGRFASPVGSWSSRR